MAKTQKLPASREVRFTAPLGTQELIGDAEQIAFEIYTGDAGNLASQVLRLELVMERDRSRSVEAFAYLLGKKLMLDGYLVIADINDALATWHGDEALNIPHELPALDVVSDEA